MGFLLGIEGLDLNPHDKKKKSTDFPLTKNFIVVGNVGELTETEREGFEPSVNKSLHSSSNATP